MLQVFADREHLQPQADSDQNAAASLVGSAAQQKEATAANATRTPPGAPAPKDLALQTTKMEQMERVSAILKPMKAPGSPSQSLLELSLADGSGSNVLVFVGVCVVLPLMLGVFFFIIYC